MAVILRYSCRYHYRCDDSNTNIFQILQVKIKKWEKTLKPQKFQHLTLNLLR